MTDQAQSQTRIIIMTESEAYARYEKYADEGFAVSLFPFFTFAGWLQHKNIKIKEGE